MVSRDLDHAGIEGHENRAAIFIAVHLGPDGRTTKAIEFRGKGTALAEAAGWLAADRNLPGIILDGITSALTFRIEQDERRNKGLTNPNPQ